MTDREDVLLHYAVDDNAVLAEYVKEYPEYRLALVRLELSKRGIGDDRRDQPLSDEELEWYAEAFFKTSDVRSPEESGGAKDD